MTAPAIRARVLAGISSGDAYRCGGPVYRAKCYTVHVAARLHGARSDGCNTFPVAGYELNRHLRLYLPRRHRDAETSILRSEVAALVRAERALFSTKEREMTLIALRIDNLADSIAPLYHRYPGQTEPQPAYVEIDEDGEVSADYSGEIGNAVPMHVWHGRTLRVSVPSMIRGNALADYLGDAETLALLQRIHAGHTVEWDGSNHVGALTDDARAALESLERDLEQMQFDESSMASVWTADEWLWSNCDLRQNWPDDQTIDAAVSAAEISVLGDGIVIDGDLRASLLDRAETDYDHGLPLGGNHIVALIASDRVTTAGATVRFTSTGAEKFAAWFSRVARPGANADAVSAEALDLLDDRLTLGEDLIYELGQSFTASGRPEIIKFEGADVRVRIES